MFILYYLILSINSASCSVDETDSSNSNPKFCTNCDTTNDVCDTCDTEKNFEWNAVSSICQCNTNSVQVPQEPADGETIACFAKSTQCTNCQDDKCYTDATGATKCAKCVANYAGDDCKACDANSVQIPQEPADGQAITCFAKSTQCTNCQDDKCYTDATGATKCAKCVANYAGDDCKACDANSVQIPQEPADGQAITCFAKSTQCTNCQDDKCYTDATGATKCAKCVANYAGDDCKACDANSVQIPQEPADGQAITCFAKSTQCTNCQDDKCYTDATGATKCAKCVANYAGDDCKACDANSVQIPQEPADGQAITCFAKSTQCTNCQDDKCYTDATGATKCAKCVANYAGDDCKACDANSVQIPQEPADGQAITCFAKSTQCTNCENDKCYTDATGASKCAQCKKGYMFDENNDCVELECSKAADNEKTGTCCSVINCEKCKADEIGTCLECTGGLSYDADLGICKDNNAIVCTDGVTTDCCAEASKNCLTCGTGDDSANCAICKVGFMLDTSTPKQCVKIQCESASDGEKRNTCCTIDHCVSCDDTTITSCKDCGADYLLEGNLCLTKLSVTIEGEAKVGVTLEAVVTPAAAANLVDYQWKSDGNNIEGAISKTLKLTAEHETHKISVTITIKAGTEGYQTTATSDQTAAVIPDDSGDTSKQVSVKITGTPTVGETLTAAVTPSEASNAVDYQWFADDKEIAGATSSTYKLTENEKGKQIHVTVTVKSGNTDYTGPASSAKTAAVAAAGSSDTPQAVTVSISGTAAVGKTLRATVTPSEASTAVNYQWYADDTAISGATGSTYVPTKDVEGKQIHVTVTVKDGNTQFTGPASSSKTSKVAPASKNGCNSQVLNCEQCRDTDDSYCERCEDEYGLRGGYCTKCGDGLFVDVDKPCKYDCATIKNCETEDNIYCTVENGEFYCLECFDEFYPSENKKSCIKRPEPSFSCSDEYPGCTSCKDHECLACAKPWVHDEEEKECICPEGYKLYDYNTQCLEIAKECNPDSNCKECLGPDKVCSECEQDYGLKDGRCSKCGEGLYVSSTEPCLITNCPDKNCANCTNFKYADDNYCKECKEGFDKNIRGFEGQCINVTTVDCNTFGCKKCYAGTNICSECDDELNMTQSIVFPGTCVCKVDYDFVDKKCVRPTGPYVQPDVDQDTLQGIGLKGTNGDYTLESEPTIDNGKKGYFVFDKEGDKSVTIDDKYGNKPYYFEISSIIQEFTVKVPENTVTDLKCSGNTLNLPHKNSININGGGDLTLNTIDGEKDLTINTVTIQRDLEELTFKSTNANITVKDLDISGSKTCNGQEPGDNFYQTICNLLRVEEESEFTPTNLKFKRIRAGLNSVINIDTGKNVDLTGAPIDLYHMANQFGNQNAPLVFTGNSKFNSNTGEIHILSMKKGEQVPVPKEEENFTVAQFDLTDQNNKDACEEMKKNFKGGEGFNQDKSTCDEYETGKYRLIATKTNDNGGGKKKDKLSAGAIAGIVIACVVVVAAIIALLVYFLVIKKKNQSTTSTQGDSSIAI